jgi:hypothetical protein
MDFPLYRCWCKATDAESGAPRYSANWVVARRAYFSVFSNRIECGDWVVPASAVTEAVLYETKQWFIPVRVLAISTDSRLLQFGFNPWARVAERLPFSFRRERVRLSYSSFSFFMRVASVGAIGYALWRW